MNTMWNTGRVVAISAVSIVLTVAVLATGMQVRAARVSPMRYVSVQRILNESTQARAAGARLQETQQQKAKDLNAKKQALDATRLELAQAGGVFSSSTRTKLQAQEKQQLAELERATAEAQNELQTLQRQIQGELQMKLKMVIDEMAKRDDIEMVMNADTAVMWAPPGSDLTAAVIERLNALAPAPAPAASTPAPAPASKGKP